MKRIISVRMTSLLAVIAAVWIAFAPKTAVHAVSLGPAADYNPIIDPADFTTEITNPYFSLPVGKKMTYEAKTEEGMERIEVLVPGWTREVMGVTTLVFWDRVWKDGELIEDTRDYLAQQISTGDLWYFGEHVDNYENGQLKDHSGAWLAGVDGAKSGIWMLANPQVNDEFRNEYYAGEAEDITKILAINETVEATAGTYTGCVKTFDWSPLFKATANKYFCKQVGGTALEVDLQGPDTPVEQRTGLVSIDLTGAINTALPDAYADEDVQAATPQANSNQPPSQPKQEQASDLAVWGVLIAILAAIVGGAWVMKNKKG